MSGQLGAVVGAQTTPSRVINWRSPSGRPEVITITLVPIVDPSGTAPVLFNSFAPFRADVTWGAGGVAASAFVDYPTVGGTFTVTAASVTVDVRPDGVAGWSPGQTIDPGVQIGAFMSLGASRPTVTPPTYTIQGDGVILGPNGGIVPVPRFARAYYVQDNIDPFTIGIDQVSWKVACENRGTPYPQPGALTTTLRSDVQIVLGASTKQRLGPTAATPAPLPPRTTHLNVLRQAGYGPPVTLSLQVVFVLDLGA